MNDLDELVKKVCNDEDTDILAFFADIDRPRDDDLINTCRNRARRKNIILLLTTRGGDPNAAFRIARCLQMVYSPKKSAQTIGTKAADSGKFVVFVNSACKSAGTLIALSADRLLMTGNAELGPLDIQLRKPDEVGERTSSLTPVQAIRHLEYQSVGLFKSHFKTLRFDSELLFSTKMAAELATKLTVGLLSPIYEQIDPIRLAEVNRSLSISSDYAERLERNLRPGALEKMVTGYPSHGFVIDRQEARELFEHVEKPSQDLFLLGEWFKILSKQYLENGEEFVMFLNDKRSASGASGGDGDGAHPHDGQGDGGSAQGGAEAGQNLSGAAPQSGAAEGSGGVSGEATAPAASPDGN